jgi:predicted signal transduction protein with EAL and GGDEF domain
MEEPLQLGDHLVRVGASIGIAVFPEDAANMESLCIAADLRMYDDKHGSAALAGQLSLEGGDSLPAADSFAVSRFPPCEMSD